VLIRLPGDKAPSAAVLQSAFGCRATDLRKVRYSNFGTFVTLPMLANLTISSGCWLFSEI